MIVDYSFVSALVLTLSRIHSALVRNELPTVSEFGLTYVPGPPRPKAAARANSLVDATKSLTGMIGDDMVAGEAPTVVASPKLSMAVSKDDPCAPKAPQAAPALSSGATGTFSMPSDTLCPGGGGAGGRRLAAACDDGSTDDSVQVSLSLFDTNIHGASEEAVPEAAASAASAAAVRHSHTYCLPSQFSIHIY